MSRWEFISNQMQSYHLEGIVTAGIIYEIFGNTFGDY
jgi:hypothetical protein